ncbi:MULTISPECIES: hypothetical protein [unclassified Vibrio]|uniref:hypothetical protein n=1 Tax=unclassified Vibrio TaxID=2614977 RepID=UPI00355142EF
MSLIKTLPLVLVAILSGCQSTSSPEEDLFVSNLCTIGDGTSSDFSQETFNQAILDCGGYEIFTEDMFIDQSLTFSFGNGKKKREMTLMEDGTGVYFKKEKGTSEAITWEIEDSGNLHLTYEDGYQWDWRLLGEEGNLWAIKSYGYTADGAEHDILSMIVTNKTAKMEDIEK